MAWSTNLRHSCWKLFQCHSAKLERHGLDLKQNITIRVALIQFKENKKSDVVESILVNRSAIQML